LSRLCIAPQQNKYGTNSKRYMKEMKKLKRQKSKPKGTIQTIENEG